jgi:hypothetical protein
MLRMWNQCERTGQPTILWSAKRGGVWYDERGCLEWQGGYTKKKAGGASPRPRSTMNGQDITPYIEFYRRAIGDPRPTLDHNCDYPACCDPDHLTPSQIGDNTANNEPRRLAFELAGYEKIEAFRYDKKGEVIELYRWAKRIYA